MGAFIYKKNVIKYKKSCKKKKEKCLHRNWRAENILELEKVSR